MHKRQGALFRTGSIHYARLCSRHRGLTGCAAITALVGLFLPPVTGAMEPEWSPRNGDFPAYPIESDRKWKLFVAGQYTGDDNLFRVSDESPPPVAGIDERGDRFLTLTAGFGVDLEHKRQRLRFNARVDDYSFDEFSLLDDTMYRGDIGWDWVLGSRLQGELGYSQSRAYPDFAELQFASSDTVTAQYAHASLDWRAMTRMAIRALFEDSTYEHEDEARADLDNEVKAATAGIFYVGRSNGSFGVQEKISEGVYPNRQAVGTVTVDNQYRESEASFVARTPLEGKIGVDLRVGYTQRRHEEVPERDFAGATGRAQLRYAMTPKVLFDFALYNELQAVEDLTASYALVRGASIAPAWAPTVKWIIQASYTYNWRSLEGNPGFVLTDTPPREDRIRAARIMLGYEPNRYISTSVSFEAGSRSSTEAGADYDYQRAYFNVMLSL